MSSSAFKGPNFSTKSLLPLSSSLPPSSAQLRQTAHTPLQGDTPTKQSNGSMIYVAPGHINKTPSHPCHHAPSHNDHYVNGASDTGNPIQLFSSSESNVNDSLKAMGSPNECTNHDQIGLRIENGTPSSALERTSTLSERVIVAQSQTESHQPARRSSLSTQTQTIPPPLNSTSTQTQINDTSDFIMQTDTEAQPPSKTYYYSNVKEPFLNKHNTKKLCKIKDKRDAINLDVIRNTKAKALSPSSPSSHSSLLSLSSSLSTTTTSSSTPSSSSPSSTSSDNRTNLLLNIHAHMGRPTNNCIHTRDNLDLDPNLPAIPKDSQSSEIKYSSSSFDSSSTDKSSGNQEIECKRNLPLKSILKKGCPSRGLLTQSGEGILPVDGRDLKININDLEESKMPSEEIEIGNGSQKHDLMVYMPMDGARKRSKKHMVQLAAMSACGFVLVLLIIAWVLSPTFM